MAFCSVIANRGFSDECMKLLTAARLVAVRLLGGVRPIAVGDTFCRLASKSLLEVAQDTMVQHLTPYQVGVAIPLLVSFSKIWRKVLLAPGSCFPLQRRQSHSCFLREASWVVSFFHSPFSFVCISIRLGKGARAVAEDMMSESGGGVAGEDIFFSRSETPKICNGLPKRKLFHVIIHTKTNSRGFERGWWAQPAPIFEEKNTLKSVTKAKNIRWMNGLSAHDLLWLFDLPIPWTVTQTNRGGKKKG